MAAVRPAAVCGRCLTPAVHRTQSGVVISADLLPQLSRCYTLFTAEEGLKPIPFNRVQLSLPIVVPCDAEVEDQMSENQYVEEEEARKKKGRLERTMRHTKGDK